MTYDDHMYHDAIEDTDCRGHVASACWCRTPSAALFGECQHQPIPTGTPQPPIPTVAELAEGLRRVATAGRSTTQLQEDARAALGHVNLALTGVAAAAIQAVTALEDARLRAYALAASHHVPAFVQDVGEEAARRVALFGDGRKAWESVADDLAAGRWTP